MQTRKALIASAAALVLMMGAGSSPAQNEAVKRTVLQQSELTGMPGREGVLYKAEFGPGAAVPKHTHPGDEFIYMAQGTVVIEPEGKEPMTLKAGDSARLPMGTVHMAHNPDPSAPAVAIVFLVTETGKPLAAMVE